MGYGDEEEALEKCAPDRSAGSRPATSEASHRARLQGVGTSSFRFAGALSVGRPFAPPGALSPLAGRLGECMGTTVSALRSFARLRGSPAHTAHRRHTGGTPVTAALVLHTFTAPPLAQRPVKPAAGLGPLREGRLAPPPPLLLLTAARARSGGARPAQAPGWGRESSRPEAGRAACQCCGVQRCSDGDGSVARPVSGVQRNYGGVGWDDPMTDDGLRTVNLYS